MAAPPEPRLSPIHASSAGPAELTAETVTLTGLAGESVAAKVIDVGRGRPFVFLHGLAGLNDHWEDVARRICDRVRCVMLELPLLHLTGDDCSIDGVTELTARFIARHVVSPESPRAVLVGNSFGGQVAMRVVLDRPSLASGLVLAGSSGLIESSIVKDIQLHPTREWLSRRIGELFYDPANMREADVDRAFRELSHRHCARAMVKLSRTGRRNNLGALIDKVSVPTLVIWGREDVVTPPEAAHELMAKLRDARIVWFDKCGHAPMIEKPEEFARAVLRFADELDAREGR